MANRETAAQAFTIEDAYAVLRKLGPSPSIILVGGQSLNFWAEQFRAGDPAIEKLAPYQSADIDFLATPLDVETCARKLGGKVFYPSPEQVNTPEVGIIHCLINGKQLKIDFLGYLAGPTRRDVERAAVNAPIEEGVVLRVMHPLNVLHSRVANVLQLRRTDSLSLRQLQTAVLVARAYIKQAMLVDARVALDLLENIFEMAISAAGLRIWALYEIDISLPIQPYENLPAKFLKVRYPQMLKRIAERREKHLKKAEAIKRRKNERR
jgi:hypothetical protein